MNNFFEEKAELVAKDLNAEGEYGSIIVALMIIGILVNAFRAWQSCNANKSLTGMKRIGIIERVALQRIIKNQLSDATSEQRSKVYNSVIKMVKGMNEEDLDRLKTIKV